MATDSIAISRMRRQQALAGAVVVLGRFLFALILMAGAEYLTTAKASPCELA